MNYNSGKIRLSALGVGLLLIAGWLVFNGSNPVRPRGQAVMADTATTTLTVLNTPPEWTTDAQEAFESSVIVPTNAGSNVVWNAVGTSPNLNNLYLLICKTSSTPTANPSAAPTCAGGSSNQWAVSTAVPSGSNATSTYTAQDTDPEINEWFAWICDGDATYPLCTATYKQGSGNTASPFVVNHRPTFTNVSNSGSLLPGDTITWYTTSSDPDSQTTSTVQLFVCRSNDFDGNSCGAGGTFCSSTIVTSNASCSYNVPIPTQDQTYNAYVYIKDYYNFPASGGSHGSNSSYVVLTAAPTIASSSIQLLNNSTSSPNLTLTVPNGETPGFQVAMTVSSINSCLSASNTPEIASVIANVYRSGVGMANCQTAGQYNTNNCYPAAVGTGTWNLSCSVGTCAGSSSLTVNATCTFPLWFNADPTDGTLASDTQYFSQNWLASAQATNWKGGTSTLTEAAIGNELVSFLAYQMTTPQIAYGGVAPGSSTSIFASTTMVAVGNVGLNQTLYGLDMCKTFPTCTGGVTSTIPVANQRYATSATTFANGTPLGYNPGSTLALAVPKTTATSSPSNRQTYWGVAVPSQVNISGDYTGQNTFIGVKSPAQTW